MVLPFQPFQITRNLNRYREIAQVFAKHGFGSLLSTMGLPAELRVPRPWRRQRREEPHARLSPAVRFRMALEELGPTFIKLGQILSTRPDLIPPTFIHELEKLQDDVPPAPWEQVRARIEQELKQPLETLFAEVDPSPLAAASLAQVHSARLHNGAKVVIKVLRPGIEKTIATDLAILHELANLLQPRLPLGKIYDLPAIAEDFAYTLNMEMDYRHEGWHADRFRHNFRNVDYLHVPHIYWDYSTQRVLVMEHIHGIKIDNRPALVAAGYDPHQIALKAANLVIKQVFEDGFFHADPHPGNLVVMEGEVIGVIDFGMMGWLTLRDRFLLMRLYSGAVQMHDERLLDGLVNLGVTTGDFNRAVLRWDIVRLLRKYHGLPLQDIRASMIINELMPIAFKHHLRLPSELWLLSRTLVVMEGVGLKLDPDFDIFAVSQGYIKKLGWQYISPKHWGPPLVKSAGDWAEFLMQSPELSLDILEQVKRGEAQLKLDIVNADSVLHRLDKLASRLAVSIVIAALILGLAFLVPNVTDQAGTLVQFLVVGAFVGATLLGLRLLWSIFKSGV